MIHSRLLALSLGSTLAILSPALAQDAKLDAPLRVEVPAGEGLAEVGDLVRSWAGQTGRRAFVTQSVSGLRVRLGVGGHSLTRGELTGLLQDHDVILVETEGRVRAMHNREAQNRVQISSGKVYLQDAALPQLNTPVTLVYQVKSGAGAAIYANLRGLLSRDSTRMGNILYIQGPERILICDLAPKVAYYREVLRSMDVVATQPRQKVTIYEVADATWSRLEKASPQEGAAALAKLANEGQATIHDEGRVNGFTFGLSRELRDGKGRSFNVDLRLYVPSNKAKGHAPTSPLLSLNLSRDGAEGARQNRRLQVEAPAPSLTTIVSAKLDSGATPTHLVVVLSPAP
jgi:hypothetical protein